MEKVPYDILLNAFCNYVSNDYDATTDSAYILEALHDCGLSDEEIVAIGLGWVLQDEA